MAISKSDKLWVEEMPWMTGYFTLAVWLSLWLAQANIPSVVEKYE